MCFGFCLFGSVRASLKKKRFSLQFQSLNPSQLRDGRRRQPQAVPQQSPRQGRHGQAEVGPRVQRVPGLDRRLHEPPARPGRRGSTP